MVGLDDADFSRANYTYTLNESLFADGARPFGGELQLWLDSYPATPLAVDNLATTIRYHNDQLRCGLRALAGSVAPNLQAFLYRFAYNATWQSGAGGCDLSWGPDFGVPHTAELSFVFGLPVYPWGPPATTCEFSATDRQMADSMMRWWSNFASSGDPNKNAAGPEGTGGNRAGWPAFGQRSQPELLLNCSAAAQQPPRNPTCGKVEAGFRANKCPLFQTVWKHKGGDIAQRSVHVGQ
eukprot:SAG25_NODE_1510_length_2868_cov_1.974359_3_plen_238_part_00